MFVINDKEQYREYIKLMVSNTRKNYGPCRTNKDKAYYSGILYGLELATDGLDEWNYTEPTINSKEVLDIYAEITVKTVITLYERGLFDPEDIDAKRFNIKTILTKSCYGIELKEEVADYWLDVFNV